MHIISKDHTNESALALISFEEMEQVGKVPDLLKMILDLKERILRMEDFNAQTEREKIPR